MKIKNKTAIAFLVLSSMMLIGVFIIIDTKSSLKDGHGHDRYTFGSDNTIIIKYDLDNSRRTVVLTGRKRDEILEIFRHASYDFNYNDEKFDFQYIVNFRTGYISYVDVNEKMFKCNEKYHELTQYQCDKIEALFNKSGN